MHYLMRYVELLHLMLQLINGPVPSALRIGYHAFSMLYCWMCLEHTISMQFIILSYQAFTLSSTFYFFFIRAADGDRRYNHSFLFLQTKLRVLLYMCAGYFLYLVLMQKNSCRGASTAISWYVSNILMNFLTRFHYFR
jgi:hypothetical protein